MRALPTPRQLEAFVTVAGTLNFHDAARKLRLSQSALSVQVRDLERLLEIKLFDRDRHAVRVTEAGRALALRAKDVLTQLDALHDEAGRFRAPFSAPLRLGVIPTVAPYVLPLLVATARSHHPDLHLVVTEDRNRPLVDQLHAGALDVLVLDLDVTMGAVDTALIVEERFVAAVPADHPLARKPVLSERDLADVPLLLLEDGHCLRERALSLCRRVGAREASDLRASALHTLVQMVDAGEGATLLPEISVEVECRGATHASSSDPIATAESAGRRIGLAWRAHSERGDAYRHARRGVARRGRGVAAPRRDRRSRPGPGA